MNMLMGGSGQQANPLADQEASPQMPQGAPNMLMSQQPSQQMPDIASLQKEQQDVSILNAMFGNLIAKKDMAAKDVLTMFTDAMRHGIVTPQHAAKLSSELPTDQQDVKKWVLTHYLKGMAINRALTEHLAQNSPMPAQNAAPPAAPNALTQGAAPNPMMAGVPNA